MKHLIKKRRTPTVSRPWGFLLFCVKVDTSVLFLQLNYITIIDFATAKSAIFYKAKFNLNFLITSSSFVILYLILHSRTDINL